MSNVNQQAVKEITKEHKTRIKDFHNVILTDIRGFQANLPDDSYIDPKVINMFINSVLLYLKSCRKFSSGELDSLATSLLQEEPTQDLNKDKYNLLKSIVSEHYGNLSADIILDIRKQVQDGIGGVSRTHQLKTTIEEIVSKAFDEGLIDMLEEMDESVTIVETDSIDELKKENMRLKAELDAYKNAIADVKKKFC